MSRNCPINYLFHLNTPRPHTKSMTNEELYQIDHANYNLSTMRLNRNVNRTTNKSQKTKRNSYKIRTNYILEHFFLISWSTSMYAEMDVLLEPPGSFKVVIASIIRLSNLKQRKQRIRIYFTIIHNGKTLYLYYVLKLPKYNLKWH